MRVTTKMLNDSMAKAGLKLNGGLLERMKEKDKTENLDPRLQKYLEKSKKDKQNQVNKVNADDKAGDDDKERIEDVVKNYLVNGKLAENLLSSKYDFWG